MQFSKPLSFPEFIQQKENKIYIGVAVAISIVYFVVLRVLYPVPSFFADSYTYVDAALYNQPVSFRPVQYSLMLNFFRNIWSSDLLLVLMQYVCSVAANLFLFFTCTFLFRTQGIYKAILFTLLIVNPLYVLLSNYVSPDVFFNAFTIAWFTSLIWIMYKPTWYLSLLQVVLLLIVFRLRYNATYFPALLVVALHFSRQTGWKKIVSGSIGIGVILMVIIHTENVTKKYIGIKTFSAFSGWQLANNALHVLQHEKINSERIKDEATKDALIYMQRFFDTTKLTYYPGKATAVFMWSNESPLKKYLKVYDDSDPYFIAWNKLGQVYGRLGKTIIMQRPLDYLHYFALPNARQYFYPELETYSRYSDGVQKLPPIIVQYYHYKTDKVTPQHLWIYRLFIYPWKTIFAVLNILFIGLSLWYVLSKRYRSSPAILNNVLICLTAFYILNFLFIVLLAPTLLRYHIFMLTLLFPAIVYYIQIITCTGAVSKPVAINNFQTAGYA